VSAAGGSGPGAPVRVAFLQAGLGFGGAERLVQSLVGRLDRGRIEPLLVNLYAPGPVGEELIAAGHRSIDRLAASKWDPATGGRLHTVLARERIDLTYVWDSTLPMFWAGLERRRAARPALVLGFHSTGRPNSGLLDRLAQRVALPVVDRFVALAGTHQEHLASHLGLAPSRIEVIGSGVDLGAFAPVPDREALRRELDLPPQAPLVGIVAALRPEKNHALFLEAAARVHARLPEARFLVVGEGPERAGIERAIARLALGPVVRLLGARRDLPRLWPALDVGVLCSHAVVETLPVALLEAHACGVPVVSTDVGSIRDVIAEGETGFLVPAGDAGALADRVGRLLGDAGLRARMGEAARRRAERLFDRSTMVRAYEDLFVRVARDPRGGR
jgi:glycosyltransferase involved in cell wall biosynthesis